MIEIRTFQGNAHSVALAIQNAETQANAYLNNQEYLVDAKAHAQTLFDPDGDSSWYIHIITVTITTQGAQPRSIEVKPMGVFVGGSTGGTRMVARILDFQERKTRLQANNAYRQALADGAPALRRIQQTYAEARGTQANDSLGKWYEYQAGVAERAAQGGGGNTGGAA